MTVSLEYLERRCAINEEVLHDLGNVVRAHLPASSAQIMAIGRAWSEAIDQLNAAERDKAASEKTETPSCARRG
jgi:hypothetical protein